MSLKLIIGRSNSGKTALMYQDIKTLEKSFNKCVVFVPDFARIVAEKEYFKYTGNLGMINTRITTLKRFAEQNVEKSKVYLNKDFLPEMSKKCIVKKCIIDSADKFNVFSKVKDTQGFADKLYKFASVFESENITKEKIEKLIGREDFLSRKFKEIYELYERVNEITKDRFVTSLDIIDIFTREINENVNSDSICYFFDYYNNFNQKELEYIKALLASGNDVSITLDLDMENKDLSDIFAISYDTYRKLIMLAKDIGVKVEEVVLKKTPNNNTALQHLQQNIFVLGAKKLDKQDNTVKLRLLKNPCDEIEFIAQDIALQVKNCGYRYNDFKIYYNNPNMYDTCIKRIFEEYGIPVYINKEENGATDSVVIFLNSLLKQVETGFIGVSTDNLIQMLKTELTPFNLHDVYMFENYICEFGIRLFNFSKSFEKNNSEGTMQSVVYDLDKVNEIREYLYSLITELKTCLNNTTDTKRYAEILYNYLRDSGVLKAYEKQLEKIKNYDLDEFSKKTQTIRKIYEIMDSISIAFDTLEFNIYTELFLYGLENIALKSIPSYIDQVEVGNIDKTRSLPKKKVYIIGAYENGLPIISNSESIFSDKEICELEELGIEVEKTSEIRNNMALFNVYKAINSCEETLVITIPSSKLTGENLRVSPVVWRIKDVININVEGNVLEEKTNNILSIKNVYEQFVKSLNDQNEREAENNILNYCLLMRDKKYSEVLNYSREKENLKIKTVEKLYKKDIYSSVSRLEKFQACHFNYFTNYVLKLKEKKEYKLSALDLGSIMHKVLEDFSKFLIESNIGFEDVLDGDGIIKLAKMQIDKSIDNIFESMYERYTSSARYVYLKNKLKKGMSNVIKYISKSFVQSEFRPLGFEIEFDSNKLFAPIEVMLANGNKMYLRGKIDRVDIAKTNEITYLRVVDYKSSGKDLKLADVKDGVALQLMTYMAALLENKEKIDDKNVVIPAAVSYLTLNTDLLNLSECVDEDKISEKLIEKMKMKGIYLNNVEVLKKLDNKFATPTSSYIDMTSRKLSNEEKALVEERFLEECKNMKSILKDIADELATGRVAPSEKENSCKYCDYVGICKKSLKSM